MMKQIRTPLVVLSVGLLGLGTLHACSTTQRGAAIGAAGGAAVGAALGNPSGHTARGAIIGAAVGGAAGAIIGRRMDQQAAELEQSIEGAEIERVGEGIHVTFDSGLMFDFDSDALRSASRTNLGNLARSLQDNPDSDVLIVGHTDSVGRADYNEGLSERRAGSAAQYLVSQGVDRSRVRAVGRGETEPVASNDTDAGRQENRRVEVAIFASEELQDQARREAGDGR